MRQVMLHSCEISSHALLLFLVELLLGVQVILLAGSHFSIAWFVYCLSVCRLSHLFKPLDGFRWYLAGIHVGSNDTLCLRNIPVTH